MTRSPRRLKEQVRETVTELPIQAARFAVMGVGRALLLTDRVRKDYREARTSGLGPVLGRLRDDAENLTGTVVGKVAGRVSGNGQAPEETKRDTEISVGKPNAQTRPTPQQRPKPAAGPPSRPAAASRPKPAPTKPTPTKSTSTRPTATKPAPKPAPQPKPEPAPEKPAAQAKPMATKDLPVSGYDEATLASVRARLRGLDARQVGQLRDYERAKRARADFLRMYENRIAKLRGER